ncbi:MAG: LytTR family transcriptional regulator [Flavobacterium micromati]|nr:LytTR family transcriptional regulator [Flavobacterium micromati]
MANIFTQPYPLPNNKKTAFLICSFAGIIIFSIFYFFQPFGLNNENQNLIVKIGLLYGLVTFIISLLITVGLTGLFPKTFDEKKWTVIKEIVFLLFIVGSIALVNLLATQFFYKLSFSFSGFFSILKYTFGFALFLVLFSVLFKQQLLVQKYKSEAKNINENRIKKDIISEEMTPRIEIVRFIGDNISEELEIEAGDFLCAEAEENYITIYYLNNHNLKKVIFRMSLKKLENQNNLPHYFFRCHKSFYVNLNNVSQLSGNAQGYKLNINLLPFLVPVSRSLNATIKQKITL